MEVALAAPRDAQAVLAQYRAASAAPGCTWNEYYPVMENVVEDIALCSLYLLRDGEEIIATASAGPFGELDDAKWAVFDNACELARVSAAPAHRGRGMAFTLASAVLDIVRERGFGSVRLLAAVTNPSAVALYERLGFIRRAEVPAWGRQYYAYERKL